MNEFFSGVFRDLLLASPIALVRHLLHSKSEALSNRPPRPFTLVFNSVFTNVLPRPSEPLPALLCDMLGAGVAGVLSELAAEHRVSDARALRLQVPSQVLGAAFLYNAVQLGLFNTYERRHGVRNDLSGVATSIAAAHASRAAVLLLLHPSVLLISQPTSVFSAAGSQSHRGFWRPALQHGWPGSISIALFFHARVWWDKRRVT
jgi:hypothetical protein